jgi:pSer/pThr/pTyr-binding forkhead associated (FHA) protein
VNHEKISGRQALEDGDIIDIGGTRIVSTKKAVAPAEAAAGR